MDVQPGDLVTYQNTQRVVVDVTSDGMAVLRTPDDEAGEHLVAVPAHELTVVRAS